MKILVISDTHKNINNIKKIINRIKNRIDFVIHLGDHVADAEYLSYEFQDVHFEYIAGNCDFGSIQPREKSLNLNGKKIYLTHGHLYNVKWGYEGLCQLAKRENADVVLFGHTHIPVIKEFENTIIMNPGSVSQPRSENGCTYGILDINDEGEIKTNIVKIKNDFF